MYVCLAITTLFTGAQMNGGAYFDEDATRVTELSIFQRAGQRITLETRASTGNPVLHLFGPAGTQVAYDDDSGGGVEARFTHTAAIAGSYRIILRGRTTDTSGRSDLYLNGAAWIPGLEAGGWIVRMVDLRASETIETVHLPNGAPRHILYLLANNGVSIQARYSNGGTDGAAAFSVSGGMTRDVVVAPVDPPGLVRLVRNDAAVAGHDADGDGLGRELEEHAGTCVDLTSLAGGFDCGGATDARDTDGDGINDRWELVGRRDMLPHQPLPKWGANPRHKDLFLELDFRKSCPDDTVVKMSASNARKMASFYDDTIAVQDQATQDLRAAQLRNPDGLPGIELHIDSGRAPLTASDATIFGDWGGHNAVEPEEVEDGGGCGYRPLSDGEAWDDEMVAARRGIFHWALGKPGNVASNNAPHRMYSMWSMGATHAAHELGHSLGLGHGGPYGAFEAGANCKPNYPSIQNYAYYDHEDEAGFSDGTRPQVFNNSAMTERNIISPADTLYFDHLESVFAYTVDRNAGHVDWNRDGVFSSGTVRAYSNYAPGGQGCEFTRYNYLDLSMATKSPALARLGDRLYAFWTAPGGDLTYAYSTGDFDCGFPEAEGCGGDSFVGPFTTAINASHGVDVTRLRIGGSDRLMIVTANANGALEATVMRRSGWLELFDPPELLLTTLSGGEPTIVAAGLFEAHVAYRGLLDRRVHTVRYLVGSGWEEERYAEQLIAGAPEHLPQMSDEASPHFDYTYLPVPEYEGIQQIYGFFADDAGTIDVWRYDFISRYFEKVDIWESPSARPEDVRGRPATAWVPFGLPDYPGRLYLVWNRDDHTRWMFTHTIGGVTKLGLEGPYDNSAHLALGVDLFFEAGIDTNLRALLSYGHIVMRFRPKADAIQDFDMTDASDWEVLGIDLCRTLMRPDGNPDPLISSPLACRAWPW